MPSAPSALAWPALASLSRSLPVVLPLLGASEGDLRILGVVLALGTAFVLYSFRCCCFQKRPPRLTVAPASPHLRPRAASSLSLKDAVHQSAMMKRIPTILKLTDHLTARQRNIPGASFVEAIGDRLRYVDVTQRTHFGGGLESIYADLNELGSRSVSPRESIESSDDEDEVVHTLRGLEIFSWLPTKALKLLARHADLVTKKKGDTVFTAGLPTDNFILISGAVTILPALTEEMPSQTADSSLPTSSKQAAAKATATLGEEVTAPAGSLITGLVLFIACCVQTPMAPTATATVATESAVIARVDYRLLERLFDVHADAKEQFLRRALLLLHRVVFTSCYRLTGLYFQTTRLKAQADAVASAPLEPLVALARELDLPLSDVQLFNSEWPDAIEVADLPDGQLLLSAMPGPRLAVVVSGTLLVTSPESGGEVSYCCGPGQGVGHLSLLTKSFNEWYIARAEGSEQPVHLVSAQGPTKVVSLKEDMYQRLVEMFPEVVGSKAKRIIAELAPMIRVMDCVTRWIQLQPGEFIVREGHAVDGLHVVLHGRVRSTRKNRLVGEYGRGAVLGEFSFMTGQHSISTLVALRRTSLAFVPLAMLRIVTKLYPEAYAFIGRTVSRKMQTLFQVDNNAAQTKRTVAIVAVSPTVPLDSFCHTLRLAVQSIGLSASVCSSSLVDEDDGISSNRSFVKRAHSLQESVVLSHLDDIEDANDVVIYKTDPHVSNWSLLSVAQADLVLFVANSTDRPALSRLELDLRAANPGVRRELVVLHVCTDREVKPPLNTREWIEILGNLATHHHVRYHPYDAAKDVMHFKSDFRRLARWLVGRSVGVVLGGGGARGASHVSMLRALEEAGIPVDIVGGTSIGAFMGALFSAKGGDSLEMHGPVARFAADMASLWLKIRDITFPVVSYVKGKQFNQMLVRVFRDLLIEDLWLPFYCVTTDLTDSRQVVHRNGYVWKYVRASMTLTGLIPPVCDVGLGADSRVHYLVDGGYTNVVPVDVMRRMIGDGGTLIAVDVQAEWSLEGEDYGDDLNGFWLMWRRLLASFGFPMPRIPTGSDIQAHLAYISSVIQGARAAEEIHVDLTLNPPIKEYSVLQFDQAKPIQERGLQYARVEVAKFVDKLVGEDDRRLELFGLKRIDPPDLSRAASLGGDDVSLVHQDGRKFASFSASSLQEGMLGGSAVGR